MQEQIMHELFIVADKIDDVMFPDDDGKICISNDKGNAIKLDESLQDFALGVRTLVELIKQM